MVFTALLVIARLVSFKGRPIVRRHVGRPIGRRPIRQESILAYIFISLSRGNLSSCLVISWYFISLSRYLVAFYLVISLNTHTQLVNGHYADCHLRKNSWSLCGYFRVNDHWFLHIHWSAIKYTFTYFPTPHLCIHFNFCFQFRRPAV